MLGVRFYMTAGDFPTAGGPRCVEDLTNILGSHLDQEFPQCRSLELHFHARCQHRSHFEFALSENVSTLNQADLTKMGAELYRTFSERIKTYLGTRNLPKINVPPTPPHEYPTLN